MSQPINTSVDELIKIIGVQQVQVVQMTTQCELAAREMNRLVLENEELKKKLEEANGRLDKANDSEPV